MLRWSGTVQNCCLPVAAGIIGIRNYTAFSETTFGNRLKRCMTNVLWQANEQGFGYAAVQMGRSCQMPLESLP